MYQKFTKCFEKLSIPTNILQHAAHHEAERKGGVFSGDPTQICELIGFLGFDRMSTMVIGADREMQQRISLQFPYIQFDRWGNGTYRIILVDRTPWVNHTTELPPSGIRWYMTRYVELMHLGYARYIFNWVGRCEETCVEDILRIGQRQSVQLSPLLVLGDALAIQPMERHEMNTQDIWKEIWHRDVVLFKHSETKVEVVLKNWWWKPTEFDNLYAAVFLERPKSLKMLHACLTTLRSCGFRGKVMFASEEYNLASVQEDFQSTLFESVDEIGVLKRLLHLKYN
jgi:hypothetical protein